LQPSQKSIQSGLNRWSRSFKLSNVHEQKKAHTH
jgi:hypothetical protein